MCGARIQLRDSRCYVIDMPSYGEVPGVIGLILIDLSSLGLWHMTPKSFAQ